MFVAILVLKPVFVTRIRLQTHVQAGLTSFLQKGALVAMWCCAILQILQYCLSSSQNSAVLPRFAMSTAEAEMNTVFYRA